MKSIQEINAAILSGTFTNDELRSINDAVTFVRNRLTNSVKRSLSVGDKVSWNSPKQGCQASGIVGKINRKYIQVKAADGKLWNVPAAMLVVV